MPSVTLTIDPTDRRDIEMYAEARGWLHHCTRSSWTVSESQIESEADDEDDDAQPDVLLTLTFDFRDHLDAGDFHHWRGLHGRGRRS
jgi:hypothetical protein